MKLSVDGEYDGDLGADNQHDDDDVYLTAASMLTRPPSVAFQR